MILYDLITDLSLSLSLSLSLIGNYVYISTDYGKNWNTVTALQPTYYWNAVSMDSTGAYMVAAQTNAIYYSTDYGTQWTQAHFPFTAANFVALCQSSSGAIVYVADGCGMMQLNEGSIYVSTDYGATWRTTGAPNAEWSQLSCDSTGTYLTGTAGAGHVYTSSNSGVSWVAQNITAISPTITGSSSSSNAGLSGGAIAGIVIAALVGVAFTALVVAVLVFDYALPCFPKKEPLLNNKV